MTQLILKTFKQSPVSVLQIRLWLEILVFVRFLEHIQLMVHANAHQIRLQRIILAPVLLVLLSLMIFVLVQRLIQLLTLQQLNRFVNVRSVQLTALILVNVHQIQLQQTEFVNAIFKTKLLRMEFVDVQLMQLQGVLIQGAEQSGNSCVCNWDQSGGWVSQGNFWCSNIGRCCTKCLKTGSQYWCLDDYWSQCTNQGNQVIGYTIGCNCPSGSTVIGNACVCSVLGAYPYNNVCQCPKNSFILNNVCSCPIGSSLINGICVCSTQNAYPDLTLAEPACLCPQYSANISNICVCPTSSIVSGKVCTCQITYTTMQNGVCTCPTNSTNVSNVCTCSSPKIYMSSGVCTCPPGSVFDSVNNQCKCTAQWKYNSTVLPYSFWGLSEGSTNTSQMKCCSSDKNYSGGANNGIRYQCSDSYITDISSVYFNSDRDFVCGGTTCNPQTWRRT
ncbi:Conserved_hypothetical protein [Hexamita inflata]|uniref:Uncharacterized protein n=1 Tax=Hexamita inflata TaxID=28002 RepID=A0AA86TXE3_9EUKA|nr:Conserved hypothetical protein [Hexamita inflata]